MTCDDSGEIYALEYRLRGGRRAFSEEEARRLPKDRYGIYALWLPAAAMGYDCVYVGMSETCVRSRLLDHLGNTDRRLNPCLYEKIGRHGLFSGDVAEFSCVLLERRESVRKLESALIREWQPECNRIHA